MKKTTWYYILTLGIGYFIARKKAIEKSKTVNTKLTTTEKIPFEVENIINAIGGKTNYVSNNATINSIKIVLKDVSLVDKDAIKKMGAKGIMMGQNDITCLFGDYSKKLSEQINENISKI